MNKKFVPERFSMDFKDLNFRYSEIARYMYSYNKQEELKGLISECIRECENSFSPRGVYLRLPVKIKENNINLSAFSVKSDGLAKLLKDSDECVLFGATVGIDIDRIIKRYSVISPVKALTFNAIGTEVLECFCDELCAYVKNKLGRNTTNRFSPGYGDLSLEIQKDIFNTLELSKNIGITLTQNLAMVPSKSVTAIFGVSNKDCPKEKKCSECNMHGCKFKH